MADDRKATNRVRLDRPTVDEFRAMLGQDKRILAVIDVPAGDLMDGLDWLNDHADERLLPDGWDGVGLQDLGYRVVGVEPNANSSNYMEGTLLIEVDADASAVEFDDDEEEEEEEEEEQEEKPRPSQIYYKVDGYGYTVTAVYANDDQESWLRRRPYLSPGELVEAAQAEARALARKHDLSENYIIRDRE